MDEHPAELRASPPSVACRSRLVAHLIITCLSGWLLGYDLCIAGAVLTPVQRSLELCYPCSDDTDAGLAECTCPGKQFAISAVSIGAVVGSLIGGISADWLGRRLSLVASDLLFALGSAGMAVATPALVTVFFAGRILVGLALGLAGAASSAYLAEIAPTAWRGRWVSTNSHLFHCQCRPREPLSFMYLICWDQISRGQ